MLTCTLLLKAATNCRNASRSCSLDEAKEPHREYEHGMNTIKSNYPVEWQLNNT